MEFEFFLITSTGEKVQYSSGIGSLEFEFHKSNFLKKLAPNG
jgi:hypothetical protein